MAAPALPGIEIDRIATRDALARFLSEDRLFSAYALADLDGANVSGARWWLARRGETPIAAALAMLDLSFRPLFLTGDVQGTGTLLRQGVREPRVIVAAPPEHRPAIEDVYRLERVDRMLRMVVDAKTFRAVPTDGCVRLGAEHVDAVIELYGLASRSYFTPRRLGRADFGSAQWRRRTRSKSRAWNTFPLLSMAAAFRRSKRTLSCPSSFGSPSSSWHSTT